MAVVYWTGAVDGDVQTAGNWDGGVPEEFDEVIFDSRSIGANGADVDDGIAVGETGGIDYNLLHFKSGHTGLIGTSSERYHTSAQKIIIEGSGTYYIEVSEDAISKDQAIPLIIINNKDAIVYLTSNENTASWVCEFTTVIVVAGNVNIGDSSIVTAVEFLYIMPKNDRKTNATVVIGIDCIRSKTTTYNMSIYMANGTCIMDSAVTLIDMKNGDFSYGTDLGGSPETGLNILTLHLYGGNFNWYPDDSGTALIATGWIYGGTFDASGTLNNDRTKFLGAGAGFDFHIFEGATFNIANDKGNISVQTNSQVWTIGRPELILSSYTQLGLLYDQP